MENLPPVIDDTPRLAPVRPPQGSPDDARSQAAEPAAPKVRAPEVATLEFEARPGALVPLAYPFSWEGRKVTGIPVRRLLTSEVAALCVGGKTPDVFDAYAVMTGFPAAVLRGLDSDDGSAVAEAAFDFLPRLLRDAYSGSS